MGMYTEFHFNSGLKKDVPKEIIEMLKYMVGYIDMDIDRKKELMTSDLFNHDLFNKKDSDWDGMLYTDSYYFPADTHSTLRFDEISNRYYLCIRCNLKNYNYEIQNFVDWIHKYLYEYNNFLGFYRHEESNEPILIYYDKRETGFHLLLKGVSKIANDIKIEIEYNKGKPNLGKKGCLRRINNLIDEVIRRDLSRHKIYYATYE